MKYEAIRSLYLHNMIQNEGISRAVAKGWITPEEGEEILQLRS